MTISERIDQFLSATAFGVVGASANRQKYGNKVLRCYQQNNYDVVPVNPKEKEIEGAQCVSSVDMLPEKIDSISVITPPQVTEQVVEQAVAKGIKNIWMQPGSESPAAISAAAEGGLNVIADGSCILVVLGYKDH